MLSVIAGSELKRPQTPLQVHLRVCPRVTDGRSGPLPAACDLLQVEQKMVAVAEFEARTTKKIVGNLVQQRYDALKARAEADLNARRQRLADKLDAEDLAMRQELLASKKTPEQRRAELAERARALAATREAERQALASTLYEKAFIQSCDVLRDENSKRILYRTIEERNAQVGGRGALAAVWLRVCVVSALAVGIRVMWQRWSCSRVQLSVGTILKVAQPLGISNVSF